MCRLFGLSASPERVSAEFWLIEAPDSLLEQSRENPDGTGLGYFGPDGSPILDKEPLPAYQDPAFAREAKRLSFVTFISHIRFATTGAKTRENCHPFAMDGRIFAHNGALGDLDRLDAQLGDERALVRGQTDSERYFALITKEIRAHDGDIKAGLAAAVRWVIDNLPIVSINFLIATPDNELFAFRYPETDRLYVLERERGGRHGGRPLHYASDLLGVHSHHMVDRPCVVIASEPLDDSPDWRLLRSGELVHVSPKLEVASTIIADGPPKHRMAPTYATTGAAVAAKRSQEGAARAGH